MILIDTPGTNDPDEIRPDRIIQNEMVNTIRVIVSSESDGINCFIQCIMPNSAGRIRKSAIDAMVACLHSLTSMYKDADPKMHPKMIIIFNDVSINPNFSNNKVKFGSSKATTNSDPQESVKLAN